MTPTSVQIPAALVPAVRDSAVLLYQSTVEGLLLTLGAYAEGEGPVDDVELQRRRLAELDAVLVQAAWFSAGERRPRGAPVTLDGPPALLRDILYGALIDAGERLALACGDSWRAEACRKSVRAAALQVIALDRLLAQLASEPG